MSVTALFTGGWLCDPFGASTTVLNVQGQATGNVNQKTTLEGVFLSQIPLFGDIVNQTPFFGDLNVSTPSFGNLASNPPLRGLLYFGGDIVSDISLKRGDSRNLEITVLNAPKRQPGDWFWDGSTVLSATNTSGISVGDWVRIPNDPQHFFRILGVLINTTISIDNPYGLVIPTGKKADSSTVIDLTNAILRMSVRHAKTDKEIFIKHSYDAGEIQITDAVNGKAVIKLRIDDTLDAEAGRYVWDTEVTRQGVLATTAGALDFTAGSDTITITGGDFTKIRRGQILVPAGTNTQRALITAIDATANTITTAGFSAWTTEAGAAFSLYEGDRDSPEGLSGSFELKKDTVR